LISAFWGSLAYTLIGGTALGTVLTLVLLPALYSTWFRVKPTEPLERDNAGSGVGEAADESDFEAKPQQV
jgi:hypothetical protein